MGGAGVTVSLRCLRPCAPRSLVGWTPDVGTTPLPIHTCTRWTTHGSLKEGSPAPRDNAGALEALC